MKSENIVEYKLLALEVVFIYFYYCGRNLRWLRKPTFFKKIPKKKHLILPPQYSLTGTNLILIIKHKTKILLKPNKY